MDTIGDRLRIARETAHERLGRKIVQGQLADEMGVTQPTVNKIETNKLKRGEIDVIKLMNAAKFLKASFLWLATGNGFMEQEDGRLLEDMETQKGFPVYWPQEIDSPSKQERFHMNVSPLLYERLSKTAFYTMVTDDGTSPHINLGDLVLVDPGGLMSVGSFVMARTANQKQPVLRRIIEGEDGYLLKPSNPDFKTRPLEKLSDLIGVAVEFRSFLLPEISYKNELEGGRPLNVIEFNKKG